MLEQMRKSSQSLLIYVLFGIVIAVFIINFGPQSRGGSCESTLADDHYAAKVAGDLVTSSDFHYGFMVADGARYGGPQAKALHLKERVMDGLISRELLAQEGERLGYVVTDEQVEDLIAEAKLIALGTPRALPVLKDGRFDYEAFKRFVQFELGLTPKNFVEEQKRELLAARVRELLRAGVSVSPSEVKSDYLRRNSQVNLEYVRFAPRAYEDAVDPSAITPADVADYAAKNEAALKKTYEERKYVFEKMPKELRLRQILVKLPPDAAADVEKAALKKAEAIAARVRKGEAFDVVAKATTEDEPSKARGGDIGWRGHGATNVPGDLEKALFDAKKGDVVGPQKGANGFYISKIENTREGNIPFADVKLELAEEKVRAGLSTTRAKAAADAALALAKADPTKTLKELFPGPSDDKTEDKDAKAKPAKGAKPAAKADPHAPRAEETGLFAAHGTREGARVEGIGVSNALAKAAFALTTAAPVAGPFEVSDNWYVVRLKERKDPDLAEFDKKKDDLAREAELQKWGEILGDWTRERCLEAKAAKRIQVNRDVLKYDDSNEPPAYEPCLGQQQRILGG
jgi:peptidyl-prolyl cis-trans isomerase D